MSIVGIVCEFNPFHNGHKYLIDAVKNNGDTVVCVMSGNFVQRCEPAIFPKEIRVKSAIKCGADIVLELPFLYATASAEYFAENAVKILSSFGCDKIAFGTENSNLELLKKATHLLLSNELDSKIKAELEKGISYPTARQNAFLEYDLDIDISQPNIILAIEYLKAIEKNNYNIEPVAIKRVGSGYNDLSTEGKYASATAIRKLIKEKEDASLFIPNEIADACNENDMVDFEKYELAFLSVLRSKTELDNKNIANVSEGLENRISNAINDSCTLEELYENTKTKRFTHSRIRRAILSTAFEITADDIEIQVPYIRLLGFNENASQVLGSCAKNSSIPFVTSYSQIKALSSDNANRVFELEQKSTAFYNIILSNPAKATTEMTYMPIKLK